MRTLILPIMWIKITDKEIKKTGKIFPVFFIR